MSNNGPLWAAGEVHRSSGVDGRCRLSPQQHRKSNTANWMQDGKLSEAAKKAIEADTAIHAESAQIACGLMAFQR